MDHVKGDKVVWIIVLLLMLLSVVFIFSSSSRLTTDEISRLDIVKDQLLVMLIGLVLLLLTYFFIGPDFLRKWSWLGFVMSFLLLLILDMEGIGPIKAPKINGAVRFLSIGGKQLHVFEVVKVAMVMYAAWGVDKLKNGQCKLLDKLSELKNMAWLKNGFVRRMILLYLPLGIIFVMVMEGSNSAAVFIAGILLVTMVVGTGEWKEALLIVAALAALVLIMFGINRIAAKAGMENPPFGRINTAISRLTPHNYEKEYLLATDAETRKNAKDKLHQPYSARIAIHQGRGLGKGPGQSTQRYVVPDMSEDYMFSFIVEEYGILGGLIVMILYISLVARGVLIVKSCGNNLFAQCAVFGLVLLISGQAFMHILVNCDLGLLTGQTLPMLSHGASAFICFSIAFGIILSISRTTSKKVDQMTKNADPLVNLISDLEDQLLEKDEYNGI